MAGNLKPIAEYLDASLNPALSKQAEASLRQGESTPGFAISLLQIVASAEFPLQTRLAGALFFKNFIKRNWVNEDGKRGLSDADGAAIKAEIVNLMISVPPSLQVQLGEAIGQIAQFDFWEQWDTLVDDLVSRLTPDNAQINNGVLTVAHTIFKRWRPLFRTDELFIEINHVLQRICEPFFQLLQSTDALIEQNKNDKKALEPYLATLNLLVKVFYDLSCQDLPPFFESNLGPIFEILHKYLTYKNPVMESDDEDEAGDLEKIRAGICEVLGLYTTKYEDAFDSLLANFIRATWELLTQIGLQQKYDILVNQALGFLKTVAKIQTHAENFNSEEVLGQVVEGILLPNMTLRESDIEMFEDEPIEFIRRNLEGSDSETRRWAATDFLRALLEKFEKKVTDVVTRYIQHYLKEYAANPAQNWQSKDTAIYLFSSIATKGTVTSVGVTSTNLLVDIVSFFTDNIRGDLEASFDAVHPILKVDAIKYLYTFRSQMTKAQLVEAFPLLAKHLASDNFVVYTYASITIERILSMTVDGHALFSSSDIGTYGKDIIQHLFGLITKSGVPEKIAENEFPMKCVMRLLIVVKEQSAPYADFVIGELVKIMGETMKNPSNPRFTHYMFECFGAIIRFNGTALKETLETTLQAPFFAVLQSEVTEFTPYVFQLLALLMEVDPASPLPEVYKSLIGPLLLPVLWENRGNVPAIVRLLAAFMPRARNDIVANGQLEPLLGVFQKLIAAKSTESSSFDLLEAIFANFDTQTLQPYLKQIFILILTRLSSSRTETLTLRFTKLCFILTLGTIPGTGPAFTVSGIDSVQPGVFLSIYSNFILPKSASFQAPLDRKFAALALTNFLLNAPIFAPNSKSFTPTLEALLRLVELPQVPVGTDVTADMHEADIDETVFGVSFASLNTCRKPARDFAPGVADVRKFVQEELKKAAQKDQALFAGLVGQSSGEIQGVVQKYLA